MHEDAKSVVRLHAGLVNSWGRLWEMATYREAALAFLRQVKKTSDLSLNEIASRVGVSHTTLTRPLGNPDYKYVPKFETLKKISLLTSVPLPAQLTDPTLTPSIVKPLNRLSVRGIVAAGMWQAVEFMQDEPLGTAPMVADDRYAGIMQWAELLQGPSMNRTYADGEYLHVVDALQLGYSPRQDDDVIVERRAAQDGKIERTCKRIAIFEGKLVLVGDSTVERWNEPLPLDNGHDDTVVQIIGFVVGSYRPRRR